MADGVQFPAVRVSCQRCDVRGRAICADCAPAELEELDRIKLYRRFAAGEMIAWAGERMPMIGSVIEGVASLSSTLPDGRRQTVGLMLPSDFLGRPGRDRAGYDVQAATEVTFCMFRAQEFERLLERSPRLSHRLLEMKLDELDVAREWMVLLGRKTARERIASLLVMFGEREAGARDGTSGTIRFPLRITREAMADYLGVTIETVSRQLSQLRREGLIRLLESRGVEISDFAALRREAGGPE
ncbi:transcriptional regulator FnrL [Amaricoccus solimangrovi]|uniref:Crp/Fnr family transcriptional regulator n=1 Tax=Amaricoccus solimangrovi TaxID=2589815 RepID=A0A501WQR0_9RHOB|nr:Crp/Fnr family transcriptional regulator [Amaricoccus solimangrovi]TPE50700.1 Crp/Fnr family transcriptional regulator [Amaricoccus solimangrovi]